MIIKALISGGTQFWQNSTITATIAYARQRRRGIDGSILVCQGTKSCCRDLIALEDTRECLKCVSESLLLASWSGAKIELFIENSLRDSLRSADLVMCKHEDAEIYNLLEDKIVRFQFDDENKGLLIHHNHRTLELDLFLDHAYTLPVDTGRWPSYLIDGFEKICNFIGI